MSGDRSAVTPRRAWGKACKKQLRAAARRANGGPQNRYALRPHGGHGLIQNLSRLANLCDAQNHERRVIGWLESAVTVPDVDVCFAKARSGFCQRACAMGKLDLSNFCFCVVKAL